MISATSTLAIASPLRLRPNSSYHKTTITYGADIGMEQALNRRAFSARAISCALDAPSAFAAPPSDPFAYRGTDRQQFLETGARREARLMLYSSLIPNLGLK